MTERAALCLDWEVLLPAGPALANHVGCVVGNTFYVHGGITKHCSIVPSNKMYRLDLNTMIWNEVRVRDSPFLSHHACVVLDDRYIVLIGGWDGQKRVSQVCVFDTVEQNWSFPKDSGFAEGAGLSSHAVSMLDSGDILVIGREGCLRTVEKFGNIYILTPNLEKMEFTYMKVADDSVSRSGHTVSVVDGSVYILGGRGDDFLEAHSGFSSTQPLGALSSTFTHIIKPEYREPMSRLPIGRKHHVAVVGKSCVLTHGGETFNGRSKTAVSDMLLMTVKPEPTFYKLGPSSVARASHVCVSVGDRILIHGGVGWRNVVYGDCHELKVWKVIPQ